MCKTRISLPRAQVQVAARNQTQGDLRNEGKERKTRWVPCLCSALMPAGGGTVGYTGTKEFHCQLIVLGKDELERINGAER